MSNVQDKIDGLIALMQRGAFEGERTQARKALERICAKNGLNIEDVIRKDQEPVNYRMKCRNKLEAAVFAQTVFRYADPVSVGTSWRGSNIILFTCKPAKFIELISAWSVLKVAWREEQEVFKLAFFRANRLFGERKEGDPEPEITEEERDRHNRAAGMASNVKKADIHKQISAPNSTL